MVLKLFGLFFINTAIACGLFSNAIVAQESGTLLVGGRALGRDRKPVANALVLAFYPPCIGCGDRIIPATKTNEEGLFAIPIDGKVGSTVNILIEPKVPTGFWSPFLADDRALAKAGIHGLPVTVRARSGTIQLGDVSPAFEYKSISIDFHKRFHFDLGAIDFDATTITIVKNNVVVFKDLVIPPWARSSSVVSLAFPEGRWGVLFSIRRENSVIDEQIIIE
jgi:hypothetical protein